MVTAVVVFLAITASNNSHTNLYVNNELLVTMRNAQHHPIPVLLLGWVWACRSELMS